MKYRRVNLQPKQILPPWRGNAGWQKLAQYANVFSLGAFAILAGFGLELYKVALELYKVALVEGTLYSF